MELKAKVINRNPQFANWKAPRAVTPGRVHRICDGWLLSLQADGGAAGFSVAPLNSETGAGLRLQLEANQTVRIASRICPESATRRGTWRAAARLRGIPEENVFPQLDAAYLARVAPTGGWLFDSQVFRETPLHEEWVELSASVQFDRPLPARNGAQSFLSRLKALFGRAPSPQDETLYLALQFSQPGMIEIDFCRLEEERLEASPVAGDPASQPAPAVRLKVKPHVGATPIEQAGIVALLDGRLLGWVHPGPAKVSGMIEIDGEPVVPLGDSAFNGAETALLLGKPGERFAVDLPSRFLDGKRHRIGLHDNLAERTIDGAETGLVLQEGLHVAERHV